MFTRRSGGGRKLRKRLDADMRHAGEIAEHYAGADYEGSLDLLGFAMRTFELAPTEDIEFLISRGCDGHEFFLRELKPNWRGLSREQRAARLATFVRFANLLEHSGAEDETSDRLAELRATVRTKVVLLASAYDVEYDDSYCRRIARNPQRFGDYELSQA